MKDLIYTILEDISDSKGYIHLKKFILEGFLITSTIIPITLISSIVTNLGIKGSLLVSFLAGFLLATIKYVFRVLKYNR